MFKQKHRKKTNISQTIKTKIGQMLRATRPKFAGPPAQGVSEPGHQCPVPVHCSLRVLDSSFWSPGDTIYGVLGGGGWPRNPPRQPPESLLGTTQKNRQKLITFRIGFWRQHGSNMAPKTHQNRSQIDAKILFHVDLTV